MKKILFVSLGCDKNSVDSEKMIGLLADNNYILTDDESEADIVIVNTCCFIGDAKEESINILIEFGNLKKASNIKYLIACGCLAQRYEKEIRESLKEVDAIIGTSSFDKIIEAINILEQEFKNKTEAISILNDVNYLPKIESPRIQITPGHFNYLKIAEGCNKNCTYCIIPKVRGTYRSVSMEELVEEARLLTLKGVKEIILVAQETTMYGIDLYGKKSLPLLIEKLCELSKLKWLRIMYMYPEEITEELVDVMSKNEKICPYFDLPIQHCSDNILKAMGRRTTKLELLEKIKMIRSKIKNVNLRTTLITGFPGETEEEHKEMLDFIKEVKFDKLGAFTYSREEGTEAFDMDNQVDEETKEKWRDEIMTLQQEIVFKKLEEYNNIVTDVLIEGKLVGEDAYIGRTRFDAPSVDGYTFVESKRELETGDMIRVKLLSHSGYDLVGVEVVVSNSL